MAYLPEQSLVFIHIPKNAGTSIIEQLGMSPHGHYSIQTHPNFKKAKHSFCVVRNPFDRLVSCYEYARMRESKWHSFEGKTPFGPHPDYHLLYDKTFKQCLELLGQNKLHHQGWKPQWYWISDKGKVKVQYILKMENLQEDLDKMFDLIGMPKIEIKKSNESSREKYEKYYDHETMKLARHYYGADLKTFGYE